MNLIPARRWWSIAAPAPVAPGRWVSCDKLDLPRPGTWPVEFLHGQTASILKSRNTKTPLQRIVNACGRATCESDFRPVLILGVHDFLIAGRQFNVFHLLP